MNTILIDCIGYIALLINLYSMSTKGEYKLRIYALIANLLYIVYGTLINAAPIIIGCVVAVFLHAYHIRAFQTNKKND